jgi:hypothetical protein
VCGELVRTVAAYAARTLRVFGLATMSDEQLPLQVGVRARVLTFLRACCQRLQGSVPLIARSR